MAGKVCLVTGATSGIGLATAEALARLGATVIVAGRDAHKCAATVERIKEQTGNQMLDCLVADLSSQNEIRRLAEEFKSRYPRLDVLVNNAGGVFFRRRDSVDGIEMTFALNHLGYFLLTNLLVDVLKASAPSRIVNVSSGMHAWYSLDFDDLQGRKKYSGLRAYGLSKLCNVLFTYELARRLDGTGVTANTMAPGMVRTNLGIREGGLMSLGWRIAGLFAQTPQEGAQTVIYLASSSEVEGVSGKYFYKLKPVPSSAQSYDEAAARRLWDVSAEMVGPV